MEAGLLVRLPIFTTEDKNMTLMQTNWATLINPVLSQPISQGLLLKDVTLASGDNTINHKLGRKLQGWFPTRFQSAFAQLYDKQNTNQMTDLTLVLNANGAVVVDLFVF